MEPILEVKNLNIYYRKRTKSIFFKDEKVQVCHNINFTIMPGEVLGLLGESGCGKSTLAKAITGVLKDYDGEIVKRSGLVQMVFQDPFSSLNPARTIGWILEEPLRILGGISKKERKERVLTMLDKVGLERGYSLRYPGELSGGQRQRVCIGSALMLKPKLLVADEPVSALDVTIQAQIMELLLRLHKQMGLSILFISHDLRVVYQMCNRVMVMKEGQIVEEGNIDEVYFSPKQIYTKELLSAAGIEQQEN